MKPEQLENAIQQSIVTQTAHFDSDQKESLEIAVATVKDIIRMAKLPVPDVQALALINLACLV